MSSQKPFVPPPEPLNRAKDPYKFQGEPYKHLETEISFNLKTIGITILLGVPYTGLIWMVYSSGLTVLAAIMLGTAVLIAGSIGLLYYLNSEEPVKPPADRNQRH
jgi:hypothetical protein